ncbi:MAG: hypothetical protein AMS20_00720 [Gemmatimonas sp. SG8_28]|nr:MAG: hypothetical protein AMS20_00720 [Gemmatimonas sp. SG8_28]
MSSGMWHTVAGGRCPACGSGRLFRGWLMLYHACSACGVRFDRYAGNWLGPTLMGYGVGGLAALSAGLLLVSRFGFFSWLAPVLVAVAASAALAALRPLKAWWIWLLWRSGLVVDEDTAAADRE